jgi:hypothetical protein
MKLNSKTIGDLQGGGIGYAIDQAIGEAMRDCENRPGMNKARLVTVQIALTPAGGALQDGANSLGTVGVKAQVKVAVPNRVGDTDFLSVASGANTDGEVEVTAHFVQLPLLNGREN